HVFLGWRHAYDNLTPKATFNFAAGSVPFFIGGVPIAQNALLIDAGFNVARLSNNLHLSVSYIGQYSNQVTDNGVAARLTWHFA
ncbi:autotransporter domain-containing protein, partial [Legionella beliardensis]